MSRDSELFIDLLRGIAALLVFVSHIVSPALVASHGDNKELWPLYGQIVGATLGAGGFWVRCFFVISGVCIHRSIMQSIRAGRFEFVGYMFSRATRIYPMFLVALSLALLACLASGIGPSLTLHQVVGTLFMLQYFTGTLPSFSPSWSLTPEIFYYIAWPLVLTTFGGSTIRASLVSASAALFTALVIVIAWKTWFGGQSDHWLVPFWVIAGLYILWLGGAWLAAGWNQVQSWTTFSRWLCAIAGIGLLYVINALLLMYNARTWMHMVVDYAALPFFIVTIAGGHHLRLSGRHDWSSFANWMGCMSFPCYVLHEPLIHLLRPFVGMQGLGLHDFSLWVVVFAIIATAGTTLERRLLKWRKNLHSEARQPQRKVAVYRGEDTRLTPQSDV